MTPDFRAALRREGRIGHESTVDADRKEHAAAVTHDPADYKRIGGLLYDRAVCPDADDCGGFDE